MIDFSIPNVYLSEPEYQYLCRVYDTMGGDNLCRYLGISKTTLAMALTRKSTFGTLADDHWQAAFFLTPFTYDKIKEGLRLL